MDINRTIESTQEQAVAAWITQLNQMRLDELVLKLSQQDENLDNALSVLAELKETVSNLMVSNRGGATGLHGFLAEATECGFGNARALIEGNSPGYTWSNDNGPVDFIKNGVDIQQKFVKSGGNYSLGAIREHLNTYPDFLKNGGKYQIPKDFYDVVKDVSKMTEEEIRKKFTSNSIPTIKQALRIKQFFDESGVGIDDIEPSLVDYGDVQQGKINDTIKKEEDSIGQRDKEKRREAYEASKPTLKEGAKVAGVGAALEGGVALVTGILSKRKEGKKLSEFTEDDWKEIGIKTGKGTLKGGLRGGAIYALTNFTATPANIASAYITAAFGIASQAKALEEGRVSQEDFVINCETVCLDVSVSAVASLTGQVLIPVPVLGAIVGNIAGEFAYEICKKYAAGRSEQIIKGYQSDMEQLNTKLQDQYLQVLIQIKAEFKKFEALEQLAFDENVNKAFFASIELGRLVGVSENELLANSEQVDAYFKV